VCVGCHNPRLTGGPVNGGDPSWPPAANLTQAEDGLKGWSFDDFKTAMIEQKRPDGTALKAPMTDIAPFAKNWSETEMKAAWAYLSSMAPAPTGG
jgi:mono/diheme cytochrome c family protein